MHLIDGESGVLVPYGDSRAFIDATAKVADSQSLVRMRRRARAHAISLDWHRVVERFGTLLTGGQQQEVRGEVASEIFAATSSGY
jgi:glycosyltransferase involved in cell wall biosynthesis